MPGIRCLVLVSVENRSRPSPNLVDRSPPMAVAGDQAQQTVLRVGAPMWSHPQWPGRHLPVGSKNTLSHYATWCNAVEGNTTFYAVPSPGSVQRWADQAPPDFRFCFKLPRTVTHDRKLRNAEEDLAAFLGAMEPVQDRCGPLLIQLPPSFNGKDLPILVAFLGRLSSQWRWAVEVRSPDFFPGGSHERSLNDALAGQAVNRVLLDSRPLFNGPCKTPGEVEAFENKPRLPIRPVATGVTPIVRFIGQTDLNANPGYWNQWLQKMIEWLDAGLEPYFFAHTPDNIDAPLLNRTFHAAVAKLVTDLTPLPTAVTPVSQMDLFETD